MEVVLLQRTLKVKSKADVRFSTSTRWQGFNATETQKLAPTNPIRRCQAQVETLRFLPSTTGRILAAVAISCSLLLYPGIAADPAPFGFSNTAYYGLIMAISLLQSYYYHARP